ncbi:MAG: HEAT repeat domain-containing protein [Brasilonema octagenarum HA4186-MV1]|jgi:DNA integrity scanning protein DisA with diadenylate cyclase activity|uniref:HEAT repeat domain-containing protein n=1 Tax=Brasilonema octagenarum TaxID=417105 RepID=UPI001B7D16AE|nr:HEAT repeat domain-containing protein [Brasilonema octagenarum]MBW4624707.1 HEAT repeat domain-containing protein [Brasilonema octagenarum HA4186-MV1]
MSETIITILGADGKEIYIQYDEQDSDELQAVETLIAALNDSHSDVRKKAAEALGEISNPEILPKLIQFPEINIYDPDIFVFARRLAVRFSKQPLLRK